MADKVSVTCMRAARISAFLTPTRPKMPLLASLTISISSFSRGTP
jgi:hypothetical protein